MILFFFSLVPYFDDFYLIFFEVLEFDDFFFTPDEIVLSLLTLPFFSAILFLLPDFSALLALLAMLPDFSAILFKLPVFENYF